MENSTLDELAYSIYQKEQEQLNQEDVYYHTQRQLDKKIDILTDRRYQLMSLVEQEREKMSYLLRHYGASYEEASEFDIVADQLLLDSEWTYQAAVGEIEYEKEECQRVFHRKRDDLDEEIYGLRRKYYELDG